MPTVEISTQLATDIHQKTFIGSGGVNAAFSGMATSVSARTKYMIPLLPTDYYYSNSNNETYQFRGQIDICKGTVPTDFSTLTAYNSRSTDILVTFKSNYPDKKFLNASSLSTGGPLELASNPSAASQSGTATWFILRTYSPLDAAVNLFHQVIGTVGTVGSGSDLEISSTSIVSGSSYRILALKFQIPTSYTY